MANTLIRASHGLTLGEKRVVAMAAAKLSPFDQNLPDEIKIRALDFADLFDLDPDTAYTQLRDAAKHLYQRSINHIEYTGKNGQIVTVHHWRWVGGASYTEKAGAVVLSFNPRLLPFLIKLRDHFTTYHLTQAAALRSTYSWRLFENIKSHQSRGTWQVDLAKFHRIMETKRSYQTNFSLLRQYLLEPACREIAEKCGVAIKWTPEKRGRKVIGLYFTADFDAEIQLGFDFDRKKDTRRLPPATRIAFPTEGISFDRTWGPIFERNITKTPIPNRDLVAEKFRSWCRKKAIALDAKGIEKTFATFCKTYR